LYDDRTLKWLFLPVYPDNVRPISGKPHSTFHHTKKHTKPDFLKFKMPGGTHVIQIEHDIDELEKERREL
jgi:hypothetical protein